ncbi:uncharacterized protein LOC133890225 [Phragmites australis]|uniref:uncharacterized protein LOC133890225 n=1 Tax=Phragmites australis TaxID=29695 RepID=UPI002D79B67A|nr:uncharacterized protein LOC133890225 [Phragmites australis]
MAGSNAVLILLVLAAAVVAAVSASSSEESSAKPTVLIPVADTPVGSFEGADGPVADDALDDEDAAPVGAPIGTSMMEPKPELTNTPPTESDSAGTSGKTAASFLVGGPVAAVAAAVAAAGVFAF